MIPAFAVVAVVGALSGTYPATTSDHHRIDREIGDGDGRVDPLEHEVALAAYLVYRTTGLIIRPRLTWLQNAAGLATYDPIDGGARVYIHRGEPPELARFTVFHEAGHVAHGHAWTLRYASAVAELWATEYAGRLVALTGSDIHAALVDARSRHSPTHGTPDERVGAMWHGYIAAGNRR